MLRAGVVAMLAAGTLAGITTPAFAQDSTVTITRLSPTTLGPGQTATLQYRVANGIAPDDDVTINVSSGDLSCSGDCGSQEAFDSNEQKNFTATLKAPNNLAAGSNRTVTVSVSANGDGRDDNKSGQVTLKGADAPQTVKSVSGRVVNSDNGKGVPDADVALNDSDNHNYSTHTDSDGDFKFTSTGSNPIAPGQVLLGAGKSGFKTNQTSTNASAGQAKTGVRISLKSTASPTATPSSASPTPEESADDTVSDSASSEQSIDAAPAGGDQSDSGGGLFSWVLIILGGLLVALGVGAIVLLVIRRREEGGEGEDGSDDPNPGPRGPRPTPGAQGVYRGAPDATMAAGSAAMGANPTMAMRPGLADAPTMLHQPVDDYPDPYGTPLRAPQPASGPPAGGTQPGYGYQGAAQPGYGPAGSPVAPSAGPASSGPPTAYGSATPTAYGAASGRATASASVSPPPDAYPPREPRDYAQPSSESGGYGYDEPTGRYDAEAGAGYGSRNGDSGYVRDSDNGYGRDGGSGGYGQEPGSYQSSRHDRGSGQHGGYDPGAGYDQPSAGNGYAQQPAPEYGGGGYGPGAGAGYEREPDERGYRGDGDYGQEPGYGQHRGYDDGYGQPRDYPAQAHEAGQGGGHDRPGYDRAPERGSERGQERGNGYEQPSPRGYDQGYYDEPTRDRGDDRSRGDRDRGDRDRDRGGRPAPRRSLDWLDD